MHIGTILNHLAARHPERPAVMLGDQSLSFHTHDTRSNRLANALIDRGLKPCVTARPRTSWAARHTLALTTGQSTTPDRHLLPQLFHATYPFHPPWEAEPSWHGACHPRHPVVA